MGKNKSTLAQDFCKGSRSEPEPKKFRCKHNPAHSNPQRNHTGFAPQDQYRRDEWKVQWAPCREADAIKYMTEEHAYDYGRRRYIHNKKPHHKSRHEARPKKDNKSSSDRGPSHPNTATPAPDLDQKMRAQATARQQHQQDQMQLPTAVPDPGFGKPFEQPQPGSMCSAMGGSDIPHPAMYMPSNYEMPVDPAINTAMRTPGPQEPQFPQGPPRDEYIVVTTEETSGPPNPRKHRTRPSHHSSRGNPTPAPMRDMALVLFGDRGMPSPPPSRWSQAHSAYSSRGGTPMPSGTPSPSVTASYHTMPRSVPTPPQHLRPDETPRMFRPSPLGMPPWARDTSP